MHRTPEEPLITYRMLTPRQARRARRRLTALRTVYAAILGAALVLPHPYRELPAAAHHAVTSATFL